MIDSFPVAKRGAQAAEFDMMTAWAAKAQIALRNMLLLVRKTLISLVPTHGFEPWTY